MSAAPKKTGGQKRTPNTDTATKRDLWTDRPSAIKVDHRANTSRAPIYDTPAELAAYLGPKCCYRLEELEALLHHPTEGLLAVGQEQPVKCYLTKSGDAHLVLGFRRHAAMLLAEVRGLLDKVPNSGGKITYTTVTEPKSQADWLRLDDHNRAENDQRKARTPMDMAYHVRYRLGLQDDHGKAPTREEVAERLGLSKRQIDRYMQLFDLPPWVQLDVHEGRMSMSAAEKLLKKEQRGNASGERPGIKHTSMRRGLGHFTAGTWSPAVLKKLAAGEVQLSGPETLALLKAIAGEALADDERTQTVDELIDALQPPKDLGPVKPAKTDNAAADETEPKRERAPRKRAVEAAQASTEETAA